MCGTEARAVVTRPVVVVPPSRGDGMRGAMATSRIVENDGVFAAVFHTTIKQLIQARDWLVVED